MLTDEQIKTLWPEIKGGLINLWGRLTEEELDRTNRDFSSISKIVEEKYTEERSEIKNRIDKLLSSFDNDTDKGLDPDVSSYQRRPINEDWNSIH